MSDGGAQQAPRDGDEVEARNRISAGASEEVRRLKRLRRSFLAFALLGSAIALVFALPFTPLSLLGFAATAGAILVMTALFLSESIRAERVATRFEALAVPIPKTAPTLDETEGTKDIVQEGE